MPIVALPEIQEAASRIAGNVRRTPVELSHSLSDRAGVPVYLKLEHRQITGAFKLRGATNAVLSLSAADRARGVACASTGNHGRALAHAASNLGIRCIVCMSKLVPENKRDAIAALGAEARIVGKSQDEAQREVDRLVAEEGFTDIPPFDHRAIVAGQGTIGLEMLDDVPEAETILVPLSGGGLIAGIAAAVKGRKPDARVIGISMERGAAMQASLSAGRPVEVEELPTLADSLGGGIGLANSWTFEAVRDLVDEVVLLSEAEIAAGIRHAYFEEREIVEGGAAVGIAALLAGKVRPQGPVVTLLSGRNIAMDLHRSVVNGADSLEAPR
ncbi:hydroxyectoine utilization dehydratase EutB [Aurantimonas sp. VKM B-3413]|uniref:hydroxyectoine utilization dehydratase EutB n=1 Tax=Aurantimonas sp. VKM B-3413 TaxID=2779401 RepID=UPI001E421332|nr:hydroxyectoine utilization dehydratase EutB [Aurantimonas sp. VKM B-3413]MCB8836423.1 hydroxyectoine utilization dehydratase EutB [Aurantimonas sp. VKM B-3413]